MLQQINTKYFKLVVDNSSIKKDTQDEISANCPACGDKKHRLHLYTTEVGDLVHCFNEGCLLNDKHHNMLNFLKIAAPEYVGQYQRETFKKSIKELKNDPQALLERVKRITNQTQVEENKTKREIPLDKLFMKCSESQECLKYLQTRGIEPKQDWYFSTEKFFEYNKKKVYLKDYLIIPIYNTEQKYKGFYSRSIHEKSFSTFLLPEAEKIWLNHPDQQPEIICEGIFDALSTGFDKCGAMLSASLSKEYIDTLSKNCIIATDNDQTGVNRAIDFAEMGFRVFVWPDIPYKDFNDMLKNYKKSEIKNIILNNTYQGLMAKVQLGIKEK